MADVVAPSVQQNHSDTNVCSHTRTQVMAEGDLRGARAAQQQTLQTEVAGLRRTVVGLEADLRHAGKEIAAAEAR